MRALAVALVVTVLGFAPCAAGDDGAADATTPRFNGTITVDGAPVVEGSEVTREASAVTTVSADQIEQLGAQDLATAVRRVPGVVISRYNPIGAFGGLDGGAFFIRGHGSSRPGSDVLTLTDGVPRMVGLFAHPLLDTLSLDPVERLEVYRSPQPVLLGTAAFGAVDMVSRRYEREGSSGRLLGSVGSFATRIGQLTYGGASGDLDFALDASNRASDGHRRNADGRVRAASARVGLRLAAAWGLRLQVHHTDGSSHDPEPVGAPPQPLVERYDTDDELYIATLEHRHDRGQGYLKLYLDNLDTDWRQWDQVNREPFASLTGSSNSGVRLRETARLWPGGELVAGVDHDLVGGSFVERHSGGDRLQTDLHLRTTAPYALLSHTFAGRLEVTPSLGVRWTASRELADVWGAQAGLRAVAGDHVVYANASRGANLPGVWAAVMYGGWGRGDEWKQLKAETVDHLEVGWQGRLGDRVQLGLALFHDRVRDALRFVPPPPPPPAFANVGAYDARGAELELFLTLASGLSGFVGATVSDSDPEQVPNLPATTATAGLAWVTRRGWRLSLDLEHVAQRWVLNPRYAVTQERVDGYRLLNGRLSLPLAFLGDRLEAFLSGENLTDSSSEYRPGYPMPGRSWTLGLAVRL